MALYTYNRAGHVIRANHRLQDWGVALAVSIAQGFGYAPGGHFFADVLKEARFYPPDWTEITRRDRVQRLFSMPVAVDGLVFEIEKKEQRQRYQKSKRLVARLGVLTPIDEPIHAAPSAAPAAFHFASQSSPPVGAAHHVPSPLPHPLAHTDAGLLNEADRLLLETVSKRLAYIEEQMMLTGANVGGLYTGTPLEFENWRYTMQRNLGRLIDHVMDRAVFEEYTALSDLNLRNSTFVKKQQKMLEDMARIESHKPKERMPDFYREDSSANQYPEDDERPDECFAE